MALVEQVYQRLPVSDKFLVSGVSNPQDAINAVLPEGFEKAGYTEVNVTTLGEHSIAYWVVECIPMRQQVVYASPLTEKMMDDNSFTQNGAIA